MASPPLRTLMGGHSVAITGRALDCAWATAAGVAVAFCSVWLFALPPPNMPPMEQPAISSVEAPTARPRTSVDIEDLIGAAPSLFMLLPPVPLKWPGRHWHLRPARLPQKRL